jgi:hydrogenase maturation protein HypF
MSGARHERSPAVSVEQAASAAAGRTNRVRARVEGTVQGVGFRPHAHRLAGELGLGGFVLNDAGGVLVEVEGPPRAVESFLARLAADAPPLAVVERVIAERREPVGETSFSIRPSGRRAAGEAQVTPDSATCEDCLRELFDPADRRHRYPFINCANCGPRFTIVREVPYDRQFTTMAGFAMCERCLAEYEDPRDRRFHAQPNACPECGPSLALLRGDGTPAPLRGAPDPLATAVLALRDGKIVAIKGIGGFHLACRADREAAVARLRARKHREDRPFALMAASAELAGRLVRLDGLARELIAGVERPIVLAPRLEGAADIAPSVAPGTPELGVMLAYSPLHHLLLAELAALADVPALVMTSGNASQEPIAYRDEDAPARLGALADLLLVHDRPIQTRTDDSVVRVLDAPSGARQQMLRRSRGYVPSALALPGGAGRPILACGAELKSTFCLARGSRAWLSHHIGDLQNYETLCSFAEGIEHFKRLLAIEPRLVAHDLHPEYLSTRYALDCEAEPIGVQHHHAHLAACLAEHGEDGPALGAIYDGTGYGLDGTIWGGELLLGDVQDFRRVGALLPARLPGGERAIREPWRMACSWLSLAEATQWPDAPRLPAALRGTVEERAWRQVAQLVDSGVSAPVTTSMGRLFDAVAALCGLRPRIGYEGQAAIELEAACDPGERRGYPLAVLRQDGITTIDPRETIRALLRDLAGGASPATIASRFHNAVGQATVRALTAVAGAEGVELVVLAGGVFQNRRLLEQVLRGLHRAGLRAIAPQRLPIGDGGISYGQAVVAARIAAGRAR